MGLRNRTLLLEETCFFVTTTCNNWKHLIRQSDSYLTIQKSLTFVNTKYEVDVLGYVIMPNHLHLIIYFKKENRLSDYMRDFKKFTSTKIRQSLNEKGQNNLLESLRNDKPNRAFQVWQDRFDDVYIADKKLLEIKLDYVHLNPLQDHWNLAKTPESYRWSSAEFYELGTQNELEVVDYREYF